MDRNLTVTALPEPHFPFGKPVPWGKRFLPHRFTIKIAERVSVDVYVRAGEVVMSVARAEQVGPVPQDAVIESREGWSGKPTLELDVEVIDGRPTCVAIRSQDGLTAEKLRFPLERIVRRATVAVSTATEQLHLLEPISVEEQMEAEAVYKRQRRQRPQRQALLPEVARIFREADPTAPVKAVAEHFNYSRQHAHRLVNRARAAGEDLPPAVAARARLEFIGEPQE